MSVLNQILTRLGTGKSGSGGINVLMDEIEEKFQSSNILATSSPVSAIAAAGTLTLSGVVIDSETFTIGDDTYEFAADSAQSVEDGNIAVDITASTTASQGSLTLDTQPVSGDTMTIGDKEFTFVPDGTANADGEISIGGDLAEAQDNVVAAINGTDGFNVASTFVTIGAFSSDVAVLTALIGGTAGDTIATTETFDAETNVFDAETLGTTTPGVDCTAANAVTAIVAASVNGVMRVTLEDGAGDTVTIVADTKGAFGNSITTVESMSNGSFGAATLEDGVDGTVPTGEGEIRVYDSKLYIHISGMTIYTATWKYTSLT